MRPSSVGRSVRRCCRSIIITKRARKLRFEVRTLLSQNNPFTLEQCISLSLSPFHTLSGNPTGILFCLLSHVLLCLYSYYNYYYYCCVVNLLFTWIKLTFIFLPLLYTSNAYCWKHSTIIEKWSMEQRSNSLPNFSLLVTSWLFAFISFWFKNEFFFWFLKMYNSRFKYNLLLNGLC